VKWRTAIIYRRVPNEPTAPRTTKPAQALGGAGPHRQAARKNEPNWAEIRTKETASSAPSRAPGERALLSARRHTTVSYRKTGAVFGTTIAPNEPNEHCKTKPA